MERTARPAVPGADDKAGSTGGEHSRSIRMDKRAAGSREPWWQHPDRRVVRSRAVGTTIVLAVLTTIAVTSTPNAIHRRTTEIAIPGPENKRGAVDRDLEPKWYGSLTTTSHQILQ